MHAARVALAALVLAAICLLGACSAEQAAENLSPPEALDLASRVEDALAAGDAAALRALMGEAGAGVGDEQLKAVLQAAPRSIESAKTIFVSRSAQWTTSGSSAVTTIQREVAAKGAPVAVITTVVRTDDAGATLVSVNVLPITEELLAASRFDLLGKSPVHYAVLGWAVLAPIACVAGVVGAVRTKRLKRRILWILFCLLSFGTLSIEWATGALGVSLLSFNLFGVGAYKDLYGPWTVQVGLPLGSLLFWLAWKTGRLVRRPAPVEATS